MEPGAGPSVNERMQGTKKFHVQVVSKSQISTDLNHLAWIDVHRLIDSYVMRSLLGMLWSFGHLIDDLNKAS